MYPGYKEFGNDVQEIFADIIRMHGLRRISADYDSVLLGNDKTQLGFSINEDNMNMSVKTSGHFYDVAELAEITAKSFYLDWEQKREARVQGYQERLTIKHIFGIIKY